MAIPQTARTPKRGRDLPWDRKAAARASRSSGIAGDSVSGAERSKPQGRSTRRRPPPGVFSTSTAPHAVQKRVVEALFSRQFGQCIDVLRSPVHAVL